MKKFLCLLASLALLWGCGGDPAREPLAPIVPESFVDPTASLSGEVTFHALEDSQVTIGNGLRVGQHAVIHGGEDRNNVPPTQTRIGNNVTVGPNAVNFRCDIGDDCVIGERALIDGSQVPAGTTIPPGTILIRYQNLGMVEW